MPHQYTHTAYYHPEPPTLTPVQQLLVFALFFAVLLHALGLSVLAPRASAFALRDMAAYKLSQLAENVGLSGLGSVDWEKVGEGMRGESGEAEDASAVGGDKGKSRVIRKYKDTQEGKDIALSRGVLFPGLLNAAGNLCFLNATLQSLASLPTLLSYLDSPPAPSRSTPPTPVITTLLTTLSSLNIPSTSRPSPLRPVALATALANSSPRRRALLASSEQQDAHELLLMIREALDDEFERVEKSRALESEGGLGELVDLAAGKSSPRKRMAGTKDPWFLLTSQRVRCMTCGYTRDVRHTGDQHVELAIPAITHCSVYELLEETTKMDLLSDYACRRCSIRATLDKLEAQRDRLALSSAPAPSPASTAPATSSTSSNAFDLPEQPVPTVAPAMTASRKERKRKVQRLVDKVTAVLEAGDYEKELGDDIKVERVEGPAGKIVRFARTPDILALHLNRSTHFGRAGAFKNTCAVSFPEILDISPYSDHPPPSNSTNAPSDPSAEVPGRDLYRLSSLVVHYGSHSFGHYVAFRRSPIPPTPESIAKGLPEWYRVSDETVEPSSINEALRANPFLLFYERVGGKDKVQRGVRGIVPRVLESWSLKGHRREVAEAPPANEGEREADVKPTGDEAEQ